MQSSFVARGLWCAAELEDGGSCARFSVDLEEGEDQLFAAFYGRAGAVRAPYYVYIAKEG